MTSPALKVVAVAALLTLPLACAPTEPATRSITFESTLPVARWDHRPEAARWSRSVIEALRGDGAPLVELVPADIETYCPAYAGAGPDQRKAFWVGLLSALAKHESTWQPEVSGGGGRWHGLLQIAPATARGYGCEATTAADLKVGAQNLTCAIRIMAVTVPRDGVIAAGGRGIAADWGPFTQSSKRAEIAAWTRDQSYCVSDRL